MLISDKLLFISATLFFACKIAVYETSDGTKNGFCSSFHSKDVERERKKKMSEPAPEAGKR